jgi:Uma2 family endonuclease
MVAAGAGPHRGGTDSEPEPDLAIYAQAPPGGRHQRTALLVVEVAVSSHMVDRNVKAHEYARAAIPTYWLVDVPDGAIEVHTEPGSSGYGCCDLYSEGTSVPSLEGVRDLDVGTLFAAGEGQV